VILLAALAIAAGVAIGRLELGGPLGVRPAPNSPEAPSTTLAEIAVSDVSDVDPQGSDGAEHPEDTALAVDGRGDTSWNTDHYNSAEFGGLKDGVGLFLDLGGRRSVSRVRLVSPVAGWTFEIRAGSTPQVDGQPLRATDGSTTFTVGSGGTVVVNLEPVQTSGLLIWITRLGADEGRYAASVAEVTVEGPA
jgi:hypothetical protein